MGKLTGNAHWFNPSRLKTRHLLLLMHLEEQGSVLRAAEAARMTQPAASKLLAEMEGLLGVPLFERHARGVEPTWYGQVLIRRARTALLEIGRAQEEIAALRDGRMGQASIGTVVNPGTNLVPQAVAAVKREHPDILVRIEMDYSRPLVAKLLDGQLDLVIGRIMDPEGGADLLFEPLPDTPLRERLLDIARAFYDMISCPQAIAGHRMLCAPNGTTPSLAQHFWEAGPARIQAGLSALLQRRVEAGELVIEDVDVAAGHFFALLKGEPHARLMIGYPSAMDEAAITRHVAGVVDLFLRAHRAAAA